MTTVSRHSSLAGAERPTPWPSHWEPARGDVPARVGGIPVTDLVREYGTPVFAVDLAWLRERMDSWAGAATHYFAAERGLAGADVYYASKAFTCVAMVRLAAERGLCLDVASGGELAVALAGGMDPAHIGVHGNNKSDAEIEAALRAGVGRIVADSLDEVALISRLAQNLGVEAPVFLRVTTGVHAGANEYVSTAHEDQKFGLSLADGRALEAARRAVALPGVRLAGLHMHIGSQVSDMEGHAVSTRALLGLRARVAAETGVLVDDVDLGGGFGITYVDEASPSATEVCVRLSEVVRESCAELGTPPPRISFEPGRHIVGPAMVTLYSVGGVKRVTLPEGTADGPGDSHSDSASAIGGRGAPESRGHARIPGVIREESPARWYVSIDAGMTDNVLRPMLYGSVYTAAVASREVSGETIEPSRLVGKHCESGDIMIRDLALPHGLERGDLIAIPATGAYGRSMAGNYNLLARPPVVAVEDSRAEVWIRRETIEDLLRLDPGAPA